MTVKAIILGVVAVTLRTPGDGLLVAESMRREDLTDSLLGYAYLSVFVSLALSIYTFAVGRQYRTPLLQSQPWRIVWIVF